MQVTQHSPDSLGALARTHYVTSSGDTDPIKLATPRSQASRWLYISCIVSHWERTEGHGGRCESFISLRQTGNRAMMGIPSLSTRSVLKEIYLLPLSQPASKHQGSQVSILTGPFGTQQGINLKGFGNTSS